MTGYSSFGGMSYVSLFPDAAGYNALEEKTIVDIAARVGRSPAQVSFAFT